MEVFGFVSLRDASSRFRQTMFMERRAAARGPLDPPKKRPALLSNIFKGRSSVKANSLLNYDAQSNWAALSDSVLHANVVDIHYASKLVVFTCRIKSGSNGPNPFRVVFTGPLGDPVYEKLERKNKSWPPLPLEARMLLRGGTFTRHFDRADGLAFTISYSEGAVVDIKGRDISNVEDCECFVD